MPNVQKAFSTDAPDRDSQAFHVRAVLVTLMKWGIFRSSSFHFLGAYSNWGDIESSRLNSSRLYSVGVECIFSCCLLAGLVGSIHGLPGELMVHTTGISDWISWAPGVVHLVISFFGQGLFWVAVGSFGIFMTCLVAQEICANYQLVLHSPVKRYYAADFQYIGAWIVRFFLLVVLWLAIARAVVACVIMPDGGWLDRIFYVVVLIYAIWAIWDWSKIIHGLFQNPAAIVFLVTGLCMILVLSAPVRMYYHIFDAFYSDLLAGETDQATMLVATAFFAIAGAVFISCRKLNSFMKQEH